MLRHILGHWKAHKRKPSLLPEEIESPNHSDDPSKVNPIFEDSEGSIASSRRNDMDSLAGDRVSTNGIDLDLVDVSVPVGVQDSNAIEENPDDVINQINLALDSSLLNEKESSDEQINSTPEPKRKDSKDISYTVEETVENKNMVPEKSEPLENQPRISRLHQIVKSHPELKKELTSDIKIFQDLPSSKNKTSVSSSDKKSEAEKIQNRYTTAAKQSAKTEETSEQIAIPSTSTGMTNDNSKTFNSTSVSDANIATPSTSAANVKEPVASKKEANVSSAVGVDSSQPALSNVEPVSDTKQKSKLKKRAIDELIKKFQGSNSEDSASIQKMPSFLHSPDKKDVSEVSKENKVAQGLAPSNEQEKEALSKIFNFPPPPTVESKRNNSQKVESSSKETKISSSEVVSKINSNFILKEAKTRTDSSLSRNKTVASSDTGGDAATNKSIGSENTKEIESVAKKVTPVISKTTNLSQPKNSPSETVLKKEKDFVKGPTPINLKEKASSPNKIDSKPPKDTKSDEIISGPSDKQSSSKTTDKLVNETKTQNVQKVKDNLAKSSRSPEAKRKASTSKKSSEDTKENDAPKSHSEDSGITRGDQISSDAPPDEPKPEPQNEKEVETTPAKRNSKERRTLQNRNKNCKRCKRHSYDGEAPLKKSLCDEYYDVLTGLHRSHKSKYSDSWTSDLSREERDIIRRLRNKRDTFRSNGPTGKMRHSRRVRNLENGYFHRHHPIRHSVSDESTINGSSMCSCDDCWLFLVKDYAYGRASLRGMAPDKVVCTCRPGRADILGRRVKFRSDTIPEVSPSERTVISPSIPEEPSKKEDATDTRSTSNLSGVSQDSVLKNGKLPDKTSKKGKSAKEPTYRLVTPWELEEWDLAMKRHLLKKRRKRARYMGFMALAMVVFVGLVVAILMVYLRRKVL